MANIKERPDHKANLSRHGHSLSHRFMFSSVVGQLLPVFSDFLLPGDHIKLSADMFTRTMPIKTPAFTRMKEHIEYFFVPMSQIYTFWGEFIYGIQDVRTALVGLDSENFKNHIARFPSEAAKNIAEYLDRHNTAVNKDEFGVNLAVNAYRLLDYLEYGYNWKEYVTGQHQDIDGDERINLARLAAYQKIWSDVYRLTDWTENDPTCYNLDRWVLNGFSDLDVGKLLKLRYRPWKMDYYTNIYPSPLMAGQSTNGIENSWNLDDVNQWLSTNGYMFQDYYTDNPTENPLTVGLDFQQDENDYHKLSTAGISTAFAIRKLSEITRRNAKHYDVQTLAHFGQKVPVGIAGEVMRLGAQSCVVQITDIVSAAASGSEPLGTMAGKGFAGMQGHGVDFTAPCHGIIMAIYSAVPESDYKRTGIDRSNIYQSRFDYYQPELDNLGMQPTFNEFYNYEIGHVQFGDPFGWQYSHFENKTKCDQIHGALANDGMSDWVTNRNYLLEWTFSRDLYIDPSYCDSIFDLDYLADGYQNGEFQTDYLIHDLYWKCNKTSVMSTYGLESL